MADIEKVVTGLEKCIADEYCDDCPYTDDCFEIDEKPYGEQLMRDALELLKEQETDIGNLNETVKNLLNAYTEIAETLIGSVQTGKGEKRMPEYHGTATLPDGKTEEIDGTLTECMEWADGFHWTEGNIKISIRKKEENT